MTASRASVLRHGFAVLVLIFGLVNAPSRCLSEFQTHRTEPNLHDTLDWLTGTSMHESGDGMEYIEFQSQRCRAVITEHRLMAKPEFVIRTAFDISDLDPNDVSVVKVFEGHSSVKIHTRNYADKILNSDNRRRDPTHGSSYEFTTNNEFASRFARAIRRAAVLCGASAATF